MYNEVASSRFKSEFFNQKLEEFYKQLHEENRHQDEYHFKEEVRKNLYEQSRKYDFLIEALFEKIEELENKLNEKK